MTSTDPALTGFVSDVSQDADTAVVVVSFPPEQTQSVRTAHLIEVEFSGGNLSSPIRVAARITEQQRDEGSYQCWLHLGQEACAIFLPRFQGRGALRVRPSVAAPAYVTLHGPESSVLLRVEVDYLSVTGLSFRVSLSQEAELAALWSFPVSLELPRHEAPLRARAKVRSRRLVGSKIAYGMQFDEQATPDFDEVRRRIHRYVMLRRRESLYGEPGRDT